VGATSLALSRPGLGGNPVNPSLLHFLGANHLALGACSAAVFGLYIFLCGVRLFARRPALHQASEVTVAAAAPGPAAISGTAVGSRSLAAPITGRECYLYRTSIWQQDSPGKNEWKNVVEETGHRSFLIKDDTGVLPVEPLGARFDLRNTFTGEFVVTPSSSHPAGIPGVVAAFLSRHGITPDRPVRIVECCLEPESPVFIAGTLQENSGIRDTSSDSNVRVTRDVASTPHAGHKHASEPRPATNSTPASPAPRPEVIRLSSGTAPTSTAKMTQQQKIAAALTRAGLARNDIWTSPEHSAPSVACDSVMVSERLQSGAHPALPSSPVAEHGAKSAAGPVPTSGLLMVKGEDDAPFLISNLTRRDFPITLDWKSIALVVTGTSLTIAGIFIFGHLRWLP
jgi:hypothetical protein